MTISKERLLRRIDEDTTCDGMRQYVECQKDCDCNSCVFPAVMRYIRMIVQSMPQEHTTPKSHWNEKQRLDYNLECDHCKAMVSDSMGLPYCPFCGYKMEGVKQCAKTSLTQ